MSLPITPAEWARRQRSRFTLRDAIDFALVVAFLVFVTWQVGRWTA